MSPLFINDQPQQLQLGLLDCTLYYRINKNTHPVV